MFDSEIVIQQEYVKPQESFLAGHENSFLQKQINDLIRAACLKDEDVTNLISMLIDGFIEEKVADPQEVIALVKEKLFSDAFINQCISAFTGVFSPHEISLLANFFQSEVAKKLFTHGEIFYDIGVTCFDVIEDVLRMYPDKEKAAATEFEMIDITAENYHKEILDSKEPVILDVYVDHCSPCELMAPIFSELCNEIGGKIKFAKLNAQKEPALAHALNITSTPTFLFFQEGQIVDRHTGKLEKGDLCMKCIQAFL